MKPDYYAMDLLLGDQSPIETNYYFYYPDENTYIVKMTRLDVLSWLKNYRKSGKTFQIIKMCFGYYILNNYPNTASPCILKVKE